MSKLQDEVEVIYPEQPHLPAVLALDTSGSMQGDAIAAVNSGLRSFRDALAKDPVARQRIEIGLVTFGHEVKSTVFCSVEDFNPPVLSASGGTPMGEAILVAADLIEQRKAQYKAVGTSYYRPWFFLVTDGQPTDMQVGDPHWTKVAQRLREGEAGKRFLFFAVGVGAADMNVLKQLTSEPAKMHDGMWDEFFASIVKNLKSRSRSNPGDAIKIESPSEGKWGVVVP
jgi:uncharacterized protein YegL